MHYPNISEKELKSRIGEDYFSDFDYSTIIGKVDFCVLPKKNSNQSEIFKQQSLLWAESKANKRDVVSMFAQLILTIGKARTFDQHLPPAFLGVFDAEKITFVPYEKVQHLFYQNDFNWNVAPSDHNTKEFAEIQTLINGILESEKHLYFFGKDDKELRFFIKNNLGKSSVNAKIQIDENNFVSIFHRWQKEIKPIIDFDFDRDKKYRFLDANFFIADLFVNDNNTTAIADDVAIRDDLFVVFQNESYRVNKDDLKLLFDAIIGIKNIPAYENFWKRYKRPPIKEYQDYILDRKDLLVPQDFRERKGAFFTPQKWVDLSQKYIADVFGKNWQEEYYVWDCCAGTGNLLVGLTNSRNIYASTLDQSDVNAIKELNKSTKKLLENNVFQFDFLNDDFFDIEEDFFDPRTGKKKGTRFVESKLPQSLQEIIKDPEKRKKLIIYINPPYAEAGNRKTFVKTGKNKSNVANDSRIYEKYKKEIAKASNELFAQFLFRIYCEIPASKIANFSTLKHLQGTNFIDFREKFQAKLEKLFLIPANTFDNVKGSFPIGFFVWDTNIKEDFRKIKANVYENKTKSKNFEIKKMGTKAIYGYKDKKRINEWIASYKLNNQDNIGFLIPGRNDFQNINYVRLANKNGNTDTLISEISRKVHLNCTPINTHSLIPVVVYMAVNYCIKQTWLNNHDQFLYPHNSWEKDVEFHNDCLVFTLFHGKNLITSKESTNHWTPFTETEIGAKETFVSSFMSDFIAGKIKKSNGNGDLFNAPKVENGTKCEFSPEGTDVFDAGRELWKHYHSQKDVNVNASLYDIREYFQGRNDKGKMNNKSTDEKYNELMSVLREKMNILADKIAEKVYLHEFLI